MAKKSKKKGKGKGKGKEAGAAAEVVGPPPEPPKHVRAIGAMLIVYAIVFAHLFVAIWPAVPGADERMFAIVPASSGDGAAAGDDDGGEGAPAAGDNAGKSAPVTGDDPGKGAPAADAVEFRPVPPEPKEITVFFFLTYHPRAELALILLVLLAGALGSVVYAMRSFAWWLGHERYSDTWTWWYVLRVPVGAVLAVGVYLVLRGGLVSVSTSTADINAYGVCGLAFITGFASRQLADWLYSVAERMFPKTPKDPENPEDPKAP